MISLSIDTRMINASGIGRYIQNLIPYFIKDSNLKITCLGNIEVLSKYHWFPEVKFINLHSKIFSVSEQIELPIKIPACDIFWSPQYNVPILPIRAKRRVITIPDVFQLAFFHKLSILKKIYVKIIVNIGVLISDKIVTISFFSLEEILKYTLANKENIEVIYCAVEDNFYGNIISSSKKEKYILFVGNIKPHKNIKNALTAFRVVSKKFNDYKFYLVGKKEGFITGYGNIANLIDGIEDKVIFTGYVSDDQLKEYYNGASLLFFPSFYEGFGLPILEAMKINIPIISSKTGSLLEIGGDAILYCDPNDIEDMADKLEYVMDNRYTLSEMKYVEQLKKFSWESAAKKYIKIFENLYAKADI
ncbi:MAG: glycosyltransferase family 4 protein [Actinobacteria bacterium]|nr:glycosyltransferase family 4 protein [Actinomycetota bacterium]